MGAGATALREAIAADLPTLLALVHGAFEEYRGRLDPPSGAHAETIETLGRALRTGAALLVSVDGQPAGCVFYHREPDHVYLGRLSVLAAYRGHGLGGALTDGVERRALAMGVPRVELGGADRAAGAARLLRAARLPGDPSRGARRVHGANLGGHAEGLAVDSHDRQP